MKCCLYKLQDFFSASRVFEVILMVARPMYVLMLLMHAERRHTFHNNLSKQRKSERLYKPCVSFDIELETCFSSNYLRFAGPVQL